MASTTQIVIRDQTLTGDTTHELTLDVLTEHLTVRELIRGRVYQEVQDYNRRLATARGGETPAEFRGLVTPTPNRPRTTREVDWREQFDRACEAFERNGFFLLIDDRQAESLDEEIILRHDTAVSFVKLVPLVGG
jgi:hypothetical protein